ncbi:Holliday junction branch migration protein RuvA [bacterium]|nr:Holliday junction branch migration protein RuvA [bacterium]
MIGFIKGSFLYSDNEAAIIDVNGVGYQVYIKSHELGGLQIGVDYQYYIQSIYRENIGVELFGFSSLKEKHVFNHLLSVSKVGPKLALSILDNLSTEELISSIIDKQITRLSSIKGIGGKTSERIILELSDKFQKQFKTAPTSKSSGNSVTIIQDLHSILQNLGYSTKQIKAVLESFQSEELQSNKLESLIKIALKRIGSI